MGRSQVLKLQLELNSMKRILKGLTSNIDDVKSTPSSIHIWNVQMSKIQKTKDRIVDIEETLNNYIKTKV